MIKKQVITPIGLHARPCAMIADAATRYKSNIWFEGVNGRFNAKSIMSIMSMGVIEGEAVTMIADGEDEDIAIETMSRKIMEELKQFI